MTSTDANKGCCSPSRETPSAPPHASAVKVIASPEPQASPADGIVNIPGGQAMTGTDAPFLAVDGEAPSRTSRVKPFRMDACTVTNARFEAFVMATGYVTEAERIGDSFVFVRHLPANSPPSQGVAAAPWWRVIPGANWRSIHGPGSEDQWDPLHPVVQITWNDANAFAKWAGGRLPSEVEWEHAARGGLGDVPFPWGDRAPNDIDFFPCNIWQGRFPDADLGRDGYRGTAPAQSFEPNGYGLYNMVGNVWEWTSRPFKVRSLKKSVVQAHKGKQTYKLTKGGSFLCHISYCHRYRIAARSGTSPDSSTSHQGMRLVYDP